MSESTLFKIPHCWKSHVTAHLFLFLCKYTEPRNWSPPAEWLCYKGNCWPANWLSWLSGHWVWLGISYLNNICMIQRDLAYLFTHLCRMYLPILINWTGQFPILELLGGIFHFNSNIKRNFSEQTVENLIRRRVLRSLIWFCAVCWCPRKRTLGLYGLRYISSKNVFTYYGAQ